MSNPVDINGQATNKELIGKFVYEPFDPRNVGKILGIANTKRQPIYKFVEVKWLKPKKGNAITIVDTIYLNDFEGLIADHKKKLKTHTDNLNKAKSTL